MILGVCVFSCFTTLQRLTLFYLCSITFLCFVLGPGVSLSYNALEKLCSHLFLSYALWKLPESQNRAISHFQCGERIYLPSMGSSTFSESLYFSCISIYIVAGTNWESSNIPFLFKVFEWEQEYPAASEKSCSEAFQETQEKTCIPNPFFHSQLLKHFLFRSQCCNYFWKNSRTTLGHSQHHKKNDCHSDTALHLR